MSTPVYRAAALGGVVSAEVRTDAQGVIRLTSTEALRWFPARLTDAFEQTVASAPERTLIAKRAGPDGDWQRISYGQMLQRVRAVGQALVDAGLSAERPLVILSDNDLEHFTLALAAQWVGVPYAPISPAYSLVSQDYGKLRHILATLTPGMVFAADGSAFARAIEACVAPDTALVFSHGEVAGRAHRRFDDLLATPPVASGEQAHARVDADTIAKFLFTSGSTKLPKAVVNTQRMLCANQQMLRQVMPFVAEEPPVLVDWLPWNHTFGGNHNCGLVLYNGGTLYIDEGKPTPAGMATTLRNLREISPTMYFNVPKGFEELAAAMEQDSVLRDSLFKRVQAFFFAGAGLSQAVWDQLDALGERSIGARVMMLTGLGMTETAPSSMFAVGPQVRSGHIGLPCPGVEIKLVPTGDGPWDKAEIRFRGPNVMPGYWRAPEQAAEAFDEEGFYCTGDAAKFIDPAHPGGGLQFDGRIAEDFKLSTGTFVSVGPLRAKVIAAGSPCVQDAVVTGINRDDIGLLIIPRIDECRALAARAAQAVGLDAATVASRPVPELLHSAPVRAFFQGLADTLWAAGTGSANRVARLHVLAEPPSIDKGEVTDKGSINQRAVLMHRAALVDALYQGSAGDPFVILPDKGRPNA
jgi:feruloyl-CoA synthase